MRFFLRSFALLLVASLTLQSPSFALRTLETDENHAGTEELEGALRSPPKAPVRSGSKAAARKFGYRLPEVTQAQFLLEYNQEGYFRPGYLGTSKPQIIAKLNGWFGKGGWKMMHRVGGMLIPEAEALQYYEDAYYEYFRIHPKHLLKLLETAKSVYDTKLEHARIPINNLDYLAVQEPGQADHFHDLAIRQAVFRLRNDYRKPELAGLRELFAAPEEVEFRGDRDIGIGGFKSEGFEWSPGKVPFHKPAWILSPALSGWWDPRSIEDFFQSNRVILLTPESRPGLLDAAVKNLIRFLKPGKLTLTDLNPPFWTLPPEVFPKDEFGKPRPFTPEETREALEQMVNLLESYWDTLPKRFRSNGFSAAKSEAREMLRTLTSPGAVSTDKDYLASHVDFMPAFFEALRAEFKGAVPVFLARDALTMVEFEQYLAALEGRRPQAPTLYQPGSRRESMSNRPRSNILDPILFKTGTVMEEIWDGLLERLELHDEPMRTLLLEGKMLDQDLLFFFQQEFRKQVVRLMEEDPDFAAYSRNLYEKQFKPLQIPEGVPVVIVDSNATGRTALHVKTIIEVLSEKEGHPRRVDVFLGWARDKIFGVPELSWHAAVPREPFHDLHWPFTYQRTKRDSGRPVFEVKTSWAKLLLLTYQSVQLYNAAVRYHRGEWTGALQAGTEEKPVPQPKPEAEAAALNPLSRPGQRVLGVTRAEFLLEYYRQGYFRPGHFGWQRKKVFTRLNEWFGEDGWEILHQIGGYPINEREAFNLYEQAYYAYFRKNPADLKSLLESASSVYDTSPDNVHIPIENLDYLAVQKPGQANHFHDLAIRRSVKRLQEDYHQPGLSALRDLFPAQEEVRFKGDHPVEIRGPKSEGSRFGPGKIPFHRPEWITQPALQGWWEPGSIEDFFQSNKVIFLTPEGRQGWLHWAIRNSARFFGSDRLSLKDIQPPFWALEPDVFPRDAQGRPRKFTPQEIKQVLRELLDFFTFAVRYLPERARPPGAISEARATYTALNNSETVTRESEFIESHVRWMPVLFRTLEERFPEAVPLFLARDTLTMHEFDDYISLLRGEAPSSRSIYQPGSRHAPLGQRQPHQAMGYILKRMEEIMERVRPSSSGGFEVFQGRFTAEVEKLLREDQTFRAYSRSLYEDQFKALEIPPGRPLVVVDGNSTGKRALYVRAVIELLSREEGQPRQVSVFVGWAREKAAGIPELDHFVAVDSEPFQSLDWPFVYERPRKGSEDLVVSVRASPSKLLLLTYQSLQLYNAAVDYVIEHSEKEELFLGTLRQAVQQGQVLMLGDRWYASAPEGRPEEIPSVIARHLPDRRADRRILAVPEEEAAVFSPANIFHQHAALIGAPVPEGILLVQIPNSLDQLNEAIRSGALPAPTGSDFLLLDANVVGENAVGQWLPGVQLSRVRITPQAMARLKAEGPKGIAALLRAADWARRSGIVLTVEDAAVESLQGYRVVVLTAA